MSIYTILALLVVGFIIGNVIVALATAKNNIHAWKDCRHDTLFQLSGVLGVAIVIVMLTSMGKIIHF